VYGVQYVGTVAEGAGGADVRTLALDIRGRMGGERPAVVAVVGTGDGKPSVVVAVNGTAQEWRLNAGDLVKVAAASLGGNGGGRPDVAQGGGTDPAAAPDAVRDVERAIGERVTSG
jgi:alanyl-tRNA synthetase